MPPAMAPRRAPTMPAQKRSGRKTVKCHRATAIVNQTTAAISISFRSSVPPVLSPATLLALAALLALRARLGAITTRWRGLGLLLLDRRGAVAPVHVEGLRLGPLGHRRGGRRRLGRRGGRRFGSRGRWLRPAVAELGHYVVLGEGRQVAHLVDQPLTAGAVGRLALLPVG